MVPVRPVAISGLFGKVKGKKNKNLSLKAKGLLSLILSLSTHWQLSVAGLSKICKEGKSSIASTINELITYGYIERKMIRDGNRIAGYQYTVFENPNFVYPENQDIENHQQYNTNDPTESRSESNDTNQLMTFQTKKLQK